MATAVSAAKVSADPTTTRSRRGRLIWRSAALLGAVVVIEYVAVPTVVGASKGLTVLGRLRPGWLIIAVLAEVGALASYAMLTRSLLPTTARPSRLRLILIVIATTALGHLVPTGGVGSAGLGYRLLSSSGVGGIDAAFALATQAVGSALVLNGLLWLALLVSIPTTGFQPVYAVVALLGMVAITATAIVVHASGHSSSRAIGIVRRIGRMIPRLGPDRLEAASRDLAHNLRHLRGDRHVLAQATAWAALNWLLDATSLWCFLAALGELTNPVTLFVAYGIGNVLAVVPISPGGLGVIDASVPAILLTFGIPVGVATLGVIGWRLVNFWLPIPAGALAYVVIRRRQRRPAS